MGKPSEIMYSVKCVCDHTHLVDPGRHSQPVKRFPEGVDAFETFVRKRGWRCIDHEWHCPPCVEERSKREFGQTMSDIREKEIQQDSIALGVSTDLPLVKQIREQGRIFHPRKPRTTT